MTDRTDFVADTQSDQRLLERLAETFRALGDPTRLRLISGLAGGSSSVGALARRVGLSISAVSHQLALLRGMHIVRAQRSGRTVSYSLDDEHVLAVFRDALVHARHTADRPQS
jgi:ArsR family transcriptional regulator